MLFAQLPIVGNHDELVITVQHGYRDRFQLNERFFIGMCGMIVQVMLFALMVFVCIIVIMIVGIVASVIVIIVIVVRRRGPAAPSFSAGAETV